MLLIILLIIIIILYFNNRSEHLTNNCTHNWSNQNYVIDESCVSSGGAGCGAFGQSNYRFCGGVGQIPCPATKCDDTPTGCYRVLPNGNRYYIEPKCTFLGGGLGCNMNGQINARFCGFGGFPKCPSNPCTPVPRPGPRPRPNPRPHPQLPSQACYNVQGGIYYFTDSRCENGGIGCDLYGKKLLRQCNPNGDKPNGLPSCPSRPCSVGKSKRKFTFVNNSGKTIYIASQCDPTKDITKEIVPNGWMMTPNARRTIEINSDLTSIRFWARTACNFDSNGMLSCQTGDCPLPDDLVATSNNGVLCNGIGGNPSTLVEFSLSSTGTDFYDISNVDASNINVSIQPHDFESANLPPDQTKFDCGSPKCRFDKSACPEELKILDDNGNYIACYSICSAINNEKQRKKFPKLQSIWTGVTVDGKPMKDLVCCACGQGNGGCSDKRSNYCCSPYANIVEPHGDTCDANSWPRVCDLADSYCPDGSNNCSSIDRLCIINKQKSKVPYRYERIFKNSCQDSYGWAFDDLNSTFQCRNADYTITFS